MAGQTSLAISIGKTKIDYTFVIAKNLSHDIIIGSNFLRKNKCTIDFEQNLLICGKNQVKLKTPVPKPEIICSTRQLTIEPLSFASIKVKVKNVNAEDEDLGIVDEKYGYHDIKLENNKPIKQRPYSIPHSKEKVVNECIDKMLKMNIIEPSKSDWASPIVLVKKPDGSE
ncbi:unnamed protein product [Brachionus calyciflorus]|uniref:Uncharacterized protein n=1 Tax=Brachionus calyciflorus TaxID=104777 RepID=A0A814FHP3_9BILA|nr:unnamed protein product [Brachionus calyciflorus]